MTCCCCGGRGYIQEDEYTVECEHCGGSKYEPGTEVENEEDED